jgi:hypothetical protein
MLLGEAGQDLRRTNWKHRGVNWVHERHSFNGAQFSFGLDQYIISKPNPNGWSLLVVKEHWWSSPEEKILRSTQWAKPIMGSHARIRDWFLIEEKRIANEPVDTKVK